MNDVWDQDVQDIADQLVFGVSFEQGVSYVGEMADLVMQARAQLATAEREREEWKGKYYEDQKREGATT